MTNTDENLFAEPLMLVDAAGLHVSSDKVAKSLEKKNISPSAITALEGCPARWAAETFVIRDLIEEEPDNAARRGNLYHQIMEDFFSFEPEERTTKKMKEVVESVFESDAYQDMSKMPDVVEWTRKGVNNYYKMGGKPQEVKVANIPDGKGGTQKGLEAFVKGKIGSAKREVLGFIDQVTENPKNCKSVIVGDWKTGAKVKRWNPNTKSTDGLAEARQQTIYARLLEQRGIEVSGARLIYPIAGQVVNIDVADNTFNERITEDIEETDAKLDHFIEQNTFEFKPDFLCGWCKFAKICPSARINRKSQKTVDSYNSQPDPELLIKGFELK